jgi:transcriptional regulator with XRE-family HTH domain
MESFPTLKIGKNIRRLREMRGISAKEIAAKLEMSVSGYHKIEQDAVGIDTKKIEKLSEILEVSIPTIMDFNDKNIVFNQNIKNGINGYINTITENKQLVEQLIAEKDARITALEKQIILLTEMVDMLKKNK